VGELQINGKPKPGIIIVLFLFYFSFVKSEEFRGHRESHITLTVIETSTFLQQKLDWQLSTEK
jgi:hypothetical protein